MHSFCTNGCQSSHRYRPPCLMSLRLTCLINRASQRFRLHVQTANRRLNGRSSISTMHDGQQSLHEIEVERLNSLHAPKLLADQCLFSGAIHLSDTPLCPHISVRDSLCLYCCANFRQCGCVVATAVFNFSTM